MLYFFFTVALGQLSPLVQTAIMLGNVSLSMLVGGAYNLLSTRAMPLAWALLTCLWCYLFYDPQRAVAERRA